MRGFRRRWVRQHVWLRLRIYGADPVPPPAPGAPGLPKRWS